ncbi:hypothetical protein EMCG_04826, partial [[Emmonsia] crescens]
IEVLVRWAKNSSVPSAPWCLSPSSFEAVPVSEVYKDERLERLKKQEYYLVNIGGVSSSQISDHWRKLRFGVTAVAWLARDLEPRRHVVLKAYTQNETNLNWGNLSHYLGYVYV